MADQKSFKQQITQAGEKVVPALRLLTIKLFDWAIPGLQNGANSLGQNLDPADRDIWTKGRSLGAKGIGGLSSTLQNLRTKLNPTAAELEQPLLPETVRTELKTAWDFVQEQLVPRVISGLTWAVEWLDPRVSSIWQKVVTIPQVTVFSAKVQQNPNWQKLSTAIAPIGRFLVQISVPKSLQPLLAKRAAMWAIGITFSLFLLLKPSHAAQSVAIKRSPKALPPQVRVLARNFDDFLPPEQGDSSISPEQIMVTDIQSQVIEATNRYGEALIQSVQTNFKLGRLIVQLTDSWYQLTPNRQEQLLDDLLDRSQNLRFKKLVIADSDRRLIARSPVVGSEMVILRR
jgi:hypothetical protein